MTLRAYHSKTALKKYGTGSVYTICNTKQFMNNIIIQLTGQKVMTTMFRLIAWKIIACSNYHLVRIMLLSTIQGSDISKVHEYMSSC